ncbi:TPA: phage major capsid protein [Clostridioides difficile]|uniref:phage major capsid protein n=1 Tax=Clostridioides TaxID=1870884 RepID=UPI00038DB8A0|nr:phage major capsid protein [Clostridioides difficile]MCC0667624.1 phage major capsid protein [Clostridioides sp. ZZV14-6153]MCC0738416.1 phage major capsid protein [Clostridioides sp. ZZV14-5902]AUA29365.1 phage major capsid protein [Clostridioides difficile]EGT4585057.1 phage major capsid protein [Clostridioides difficile]EGT5082487.1 phage major capsid protein [Clostridioides difficile]
MNKELRELLEKINNKKVEARKLIEDDKLDEGKVIKNEIAILRDKFNVLKDLYEEEMGEIENMTDISRTKVDEKESIVAFNKAVLGKSLTETQSALVEKVEEDGGYLVPKEQRTQIEELKRQLIPLKQYCNVVPVATLSGSMPLEVDANDELINFDEMEEINQSDIKFGQVKWLLNDYGDIIPISNSLLQDEKANLTNYVGARFSKKAVRTENKKILEVLSKSKKVEGEDYKTIQTALNKELDPSISANAIIITNQDGYDYLDSLTDSNNRPLMSDSLTVEGAKTFKGKIVVVLSNQHFSSTASKLTFYVGDLSSAVAFFDRQVYEMAVSKEAGFTKNATFMRVIERFDVQSIDNKAMVNVELTLPTQSAIAKSIKK